MNKLSQIIYLNTFINYIFYSINIILSFVLIRLTLQYLGNSLYGVFVTITSLFSLVGFSDLGIGNGLRNKIAEAYAHKNENLQIKLITTSFWYLLKISFLVFVFMIVLAEMLIFFNVFESEFRLSIYLFFFFFCSDLSLGLCKSVVLGLQKSWLVQLSVGVSIFFKIVSLMFLKYNYNDMPNFNLFALLFGVSGVLGNIVLIFIITRFILNIRKKDFSRKYSFKGLMDIKKVGHQFFLLQICCLILYSTDNVIIKKLFSSVEVTRYDIISKFYLYGDNLFSVLLISLWSAVTVSLTNNDYRWINKEKRRLLVIWFFYSIGVIIVTYFFNDIILIWLGGVAPIYDKYILLLFAVYNIWGAFGSIFVNITNGLGRLSLQVKCSIIAAVTNIPLSIYLSVHLGLGIMGIKLATLLCLIGSNLLIPIDILFYLKRKIITS